MLDMAGGLEREPKEVCALPRPQDTAESCQGVPMAQVPVLPFLLGNMELPTSSPGQESQ